MGYSQIWDNALYQSDEDYIERGRELLDQAVARAISDEPKFAVLASGGLDSSAIVSTLARSSLAAVPCYTGGGGGGGVKGRYARPLFRRGPEDGDACEPVSGLAI